MNVLFFSEDFHPITAGGAFEDTNVATAAVEAGHTITVLTFRSEDLSSEEIHQDLKIERPIKPPFINREINSPLNILGRILGAMSLILIGGVYLWRRDFDVLYSTNHIAHPVASLLSLLFRIPLVSFVAYTPSLNPDNRELTNPLFIFEQVNFRLFMGDIVYCRNPEVQGIIQSYNRRSKVELAHGILNEQAIRSTADNLASKGYTPRQWLAKRTDIDPDSKIISFVGRFSTLKRPEIAVKTIAELPSDYELVFVGDGTRRHAVEIAVEELGVEDQVHFLGLVPHDEAIRTLIASDHLLLTSEVESYPTVVFEALACSCTIAAPPIGILPHLDFPEHQLRLTYSEDFATAIKELSDGESGLNEGVLEAFSINRFGQEVSAAFIEIAEQS